MFAYENCRSCMLMKIMIVGMVWVYSTSRYVAVSAGNGQFDEYT